MIDQTFVQKKQKSKPYKVDFFETEPDCTDKALVKKSINNWLESYPDKSKRPTDSDDILQDIIDAMSRTDARWKTAKPSDKKCTRLRYRTLYYAYRYAV